MTTDTRDALLQVAKELRGWRGHRGHYSDTLVAWAERIETALHTPHPESRDARDAALVLAKRRFREINGQVSYEVWCGNYEAMAAIDAALTQPEAK